MSNIIYKIIETTDASPSLEWLATGEAMHNRLGAFSESLVLYGALVKKSIELCKRARIISVGLGLGYNELISFAQCLALNMDDIYLESFEENNDLRTQWLSWLNDQPAPLTNVYDKIAELCEKEFHLSPKGLLKSKMKIALDNETLVLRDRLDLNTAFSQKFHCVLYDPFSAKTNPDCWSEEFLKDFFNKVCERICLVSTYAAKGNLKRSLKTLGFTVENPPGFGGKRQCTIASRNNSN